ncbi:unnamed protein product [Meloidogyne enterolobii]|uniref:Uncharacterized protein n=1 Tax=Meloidogyne enterolobii TaxID=390850 RepID=A0ACB0ZZ36_MELEN
MTVSSDLHRSSKSSIDALLLHKTDWRSIYFITSVAMMDSMRISTVLSNSWPYISSLDPEITENFNGLGVSVYTLGEDFVIQPLTNLSTSPYVPFTLLPLCFLHPTVPFTLLRLCILHSTVPFALPLTHSHSSLTN